MSEQLYDILNKKHFTESGILNDKQLLLDSAVAAGCDRDACATFLSSSKLVPEIMATVNKVHSLGIHSIPTLLIDGGRIIVQGAAEAAEVAAGLRKAVQMRLDERSSPSDMSKDYVVERVFRSTLYYPVK